MGVLDSTEAGLFTNVISGCEVGMNDMCGVGVVDEAETGLVVNVMSGFEVGMNGRGAFRLVMIGIDVIRGVYIGVGVGV